MVCNGVYLLLVCTVCYWIETSTANNFSFDLYEDALAHSGLGTLEARRENLCKSFMRKLRPNNNANNNNPVAQIINTFSQVPEHSYHLKTQSTNVLFTRTDRFKNFITIKYFF